VKRRLYKRADESDLRDCNDARRIYEDRSTDILWNRRSVYTGVVSDEDDGKDYELSITGSKKLIETILSKSDFDIEIARVSRRMNSKNGHDVSGIAV